MPEYLAPGVFVEEVSFRPQSIEGVGTSTTGFVGPTRSGPTRIAEPPLLTSFADFERIYGGLDALNYTDGTTASINYLAQAVRAYFEEGGRRLYVSRTYNDAVAADTVRDVPNFTGGAWSEAVLASGAVLPIRREPPTSTTRWNWSWCWARRSSVPRRTRPHRRSTPMAAGST